MKNSVAMLLELPTVEVVDGSHFFVSHHLHTWFKVHIISQGGKQDILKSSLVTHITSSLSLERENNLKSRVFFLTVTLSLLASIH